VGTRATYTIAAAGIGALALGSLAVLWSLDPSTPRPPAAGAGAPAAPLPAPGEPASSAAGLDSAERPPSPLPAPGAPAEPAPVPAESDPVDDPSWRTVPVITGFRTLGPIGRDLRAGVRRSRLEVARCFRDHPSDSAGAAGGGRRAATLLLYLEARAGELEVVGATVADPGASPPAQVDCVRWILRGYRIPSSTAVRGRRYKVRLALEP